jgi:hypothetical protein
VADSAHIRSLGSHILIENVAGEGFRRECRELDHDRALLADLGHPWPHRMNFRSRPFSDGHPAPKESLRTAGADIPPQDNGRLIPTALEDVQTTPSAIVAGGIFLTRSYTRRPD